MVNNRKKFFNLVLNELEEKVRLLFPDVDFISQPEAQQYSSIKEMLKKQYQRQKDTEKDSQVHYETYINDRFFLNNFISLI